MIRLVLLPFACLALAAAPLAGQALTREQEDFRASPNGPLLGVLQAGAALAVIEQRDSWVLGELEGWMWARSLQVRAEGAFDLVVSEPDGENLRAEPSGQIVARLARGTLLEEVERTAGWIRVRRRGWIRAPSLELAAAPAGAEPDTAVAAAVAPDSAAALAADPDTAAALAADPDTAAAADPDPVPVLPAQVVAEPERYHGRIVRWELQFIALERADSIRTDFAEGEPFLLTRLPAGAGSFVYVAVPPERLAEVASLLPLDRITVLGRIRTGASALTGSPIVELRELHRGRPPAPPRS